MAHSKVFLWAVGSPLLLSIVSVWVRASRVGYRMGDGIIEHFAGHMLCGTIPGSWILTLNSETIYGPHGEHVTAPLIPTSWELLSSPELWLGAAAGLAMLAAAAWLRRWRGEA